MSVTPLVMGLIQVNQRKITEQVSSLGTGLATLQKALEALTTEVETSQNALHKGSEQVVRLEDDVRVYKESVGGKLSSQEKRTVSIEQRLSKLEQTMDNYEKENRQLKCDLQSQADTVERLQAEVASLHAMLQLVQPNWIISVEEINIGNRELGRGSWGYVRQATFRGHNVAAKCSHSEIISVYNSRLFHREMLIASQCRHPNLLQFIGATLQGNPIIITELMETSLRALLEQQALDHRHILPVCRDVAMAINYLHNLIPDPVIHRDVSSSNVLLNSLPQPAGGWLAKLSDYGSANFAWRSRTVGPGCPTYAAPEASSVINHTPKMDVYSYGVLLLEVCTGELPDISSMVGILAAPNWEPPHFHLIQVIRDCVNLNYQERPAMQSILDHINREL